MRPILLLLIIALLTGCAKDAPRVSVTIIGDWTWIKSTGISPNDFTPQSSGKSWGLDFKADSTCMQDGDLMSAASGNYSLETGTTPSGNLQQIHITFPTEVKTYSYSFISPDTLRLDGNLTVDDLSNFFVRRQQ